MKTLLRKEIRTQLPFLVLVIFLCIADPVFTWIGGFPDMKSLPAQVHDFYDESGRNIPVFLIAFALGLGLVVREKDEGTLEFLDALPLSRAQVFLAKVFTGWLILGLLPFVSNAIVFGQHLLSRDSLEPHWHLGFLGQSTFIECVELVVFLGIGLFLSFLRRFAFLALALLWFLWMALSRFEVPWIDLLNPLALDDYDYHGSSIVIPWTRIAVLSTIAAFCYGGAYGLFAMQGDGKVRAGTWIDRYHLRGPLVAAGTVVIVVVWIAIGIFYASRDSDDSSAIGTVQYTPWETVRASGGGYTFSYRSNLGERAGALLERSGAVHRQVREFFEAEAPPTIVADLDSGLRHGVGGTANWKRVNMNLILTSDVDELAAILGHETAHVYIDILSDGRLKDDFESSRWFHEGMASYVEHRFFRPPERIDKLRRVAAVAFHRKQADFEELVNASAWGMKFDPHLVYPLGEVFSAVLVERHGDDAPAKLLRAIARKDAPEKLTGLDLWRDAFQECGWNLSDSAADYFRMLERLARNEYKEFVESIPRLAVNIDGDSDSVYITIDPRGAVPEGAEFVVRVRRNETDDEHDYVSAHSVDDRKFVLSRSRLAGNNFWVQAGINLPEVELPLYEEWRRARVR